MLAFQSATHVRFTLFYTDVFVLSLQNPRCILTHIGPATVQMLHGHMGLVAVPMRPTLAQPLALELPLSPQPSCLTTGQGIGEEPVWGPSLRCNCSFRVLTYLWLVASDFAWKPKTKSNALWTIYWHFCFVNAHIGLGTVGSLWWGSIHGSKHLPGALSLGSHE